MTTPDVWRPEAALLAATVATLQSAVVVGSTPIRVDVDVLTGDPTPPMILLQVLGTHVSGEAMTRADELVRVELRVTVITDVVSQARQIRSRAATALAGRDGDGRFWAALGVSGFVVVDRNIVSPMPAPDIAAGWCNARLDVQAYLQAVSAG